MKNITKKRLDYLIKDEMKAYKEYTKLGLYSLAKDELKHYEYLKKIRDEK
jgi:hypothetical protein